MLKRARYFIRRLLNYRAKAQLDALCERYELLANTLASQEKYEIDLLIRPYAHLQAGKNVINRLERDIEAFSPFLGRIGDCDGFKVHLSHYPKVISEGLFLLNLHYENQPLYKLSLSVLDGRLLICCAQGAAAASALKIATKAAHGLRPINFALFIAEALAARLNLQLAGVRENAQISRAKRRKNDFINYDELWRQNAEITGVCEDFYELKISKKPLELIASKKRSEYRRRYALIDEILREFLPEICEAKASEKGEKMSEKAGEKTIKKEEK